MDQAINNLTPQQKQAVMMRAQQEANQQIMQSMLEKMVSTCFKKCAGTSGDKLDSREQSCMASCQDRYFDVREQVQLALQKRQDSM
ncbi:zf-Tim10_DDP-domain-containing protein [Chaetoceros tenuissimus]|uniref:Mitochondrial import inner membrane translocase subunit n=1 Tax=Chaetoceros tenuissimus TaxID=426638 RepID=A0AAD3D6X0_9STRA|nr:zf-Tim10_DDP-domain-containing protein [Chaetoceros tenuissimus]